MGEKCLLFGIDFDLRMRAKCAKQNALHFALFSFTRGEDAPANLLCDERMIARKLFQHPGAEKIGAAVADVSNTKRVVVNPKRRKRGTHPALLGVSFGGGKNVFVCEMHRADEPLGGSIQVGNGIAVSRRG